MPTRGKGDTNDDTVTMITPITDIAGMTATTASRMGTVQPSMMSTVNAKIAAAINQLSANQTAIMTQMAALSFTQAILTWSDQVRSLAGLGRSTLEPFSLLLV
jgi:hypothetical protein